MNFQIIQYQTNPVSISGYFESSIFRNSIYSLLLCLSFTSGIASPVCKSIPASSENSSKTFIFIITADRLVIFIRQEVFCGIGNCLNSGFFGVYIQCKEEPDRVDRAVNGLQLSSVLFEPWDTGGNFVCRRR